MNQSGPGPASIAQITELLAWARRLTDAGRHADPAERAAYLAAKADLLARIADTHPVEHPCHPDAARDIATQAPTAADQATALLPTQPRTTNDR